MKHMIAVFLVCIIQPGIAMNSLDAFRNSESDELVMTIKDDGILFTYTDSGWESVGEPCSGSGPFSLHIMERVGVEREALVFVTDSSGQLFQTNGDWWIELIEPPETASHVSISSIFSFSGTILHLVLLDVEGNLFISDSDEHWSSPFATFPSNPPRDMSFYYDEATSTMIPYIIGSDGGLYGYLDGSWQSTGQLEKGWNIQKLESYVYPETGAVFMVAIDDSGRVFDNSIQGILAETNHEPCPGTGPWDLELQNSGLDSFDLLCIDSTGQLFLASDGSWNKVADSFPVD